MKTVHSIFASLCTARTTTICSSYFSFISPKCSGIRGWEGVNVIHNRFNWGKAKLESERNRQGVFDQIISDLEQFKSSRVNSDPGRKVDSATPISLGLSWPLTNRRLLGVAIAIYFHYGVYMLKSSRPRLLQPILPTELEAILCWSRLRSHYVSAVKRSCQNRLHHNTQRQKKMGRRENSRDGKISTFANPRLDKVTKRERRKRRRYLKLECRPRKIKRMMKNKSEDEKNNNETMMSKFCSHKRWCFMIDFTTFFTSTHRIHVWNI